MKKGFTLAEVLITLSIVGIIAALTVPSIVSNYKNRVYISGVKKAVAELEHATKAIMNDEHVDDFYKTTAAAKNEVSIDGLTYSNGAEYFLNTYFKWQDDTRDKCVSGEYKTKAGVDAVTIASNDGTYCSKNTNGIAYCMRYNDDTDDTEPFMSVFFDINGKAAPNITGIDAFVVRINEDGSLEDTDTSEPVDDGPKKCFNSVGSDVRDHAAGCLKQLMDNNWVYPE